MASTTERLEAAPSHVASDSSLRKIDWSALEVQTTAKAFLAFWGRLCVLLFLL